MGGRWRVAIKAYPIQDATMDLDAEVWEEGVVYGNGKGSGFRGEMDDRRRLFLTD